MTTQDDLQGHWQRGWITAPDFEDHTTRVHWLQAGALFADLRIPLVRPDVQGLSCLGDLDPSGLKLLLAAEGFAGHITVADRACTWHRSVNWHGIPGRPDTGLMSFDAAGDLIEDGVHADYRELWHAVPQTPLRGHRVTSGLLSGVLIENDDVFLLGLGPHPAGTTNAVLASLDAGTVDGTALQTLFESEYVMGRWNGPIGTADLSTNPLQEGQVVLERSARFIWHALAFDGTRHARPLVVDQPHP